MGTRELKHEARLEEWKERIKACRSSGMSVVEWCQCQGISSKTYYHWEREYLSEATKELTIPQVGKQLIRVEPKNLRNEKQDLEETTGILIRHGITTIELPSGISIKMIADLVSTLNQYV